MFNGEVDRLTLTKAVSTRFLLGAVCRRSHEVAAPIHMQTLNLPTQFSEAEATWVEFESIRQLGAKVLGTQTLAHAAIIFLFALLYQHTPTTTWLTWLAFHGLVVISRVWFASGYHVRGSRSNASVQTAFYLRYNLVIALVGFAWGSTVYLFYGQVPSTIAAIYSYYILVYGLISTIYLSSHLQSLNLFVRGYSLGLIGALLARIVFAPVIEVNVASGVLLLGVALLISIMMKFGKQLNRAHVNSLQLAYRNQNLITSLTQEKQTAIDAIATKNRLIASTAHDMRQPVLALDLYANWLVEDPSLSTELTPKIAGATRAVIALFDSMFDLAQLAEGQVIVSLAPVNLKTLLQELCIQHQIVAVSKNLKLRARLIEAEIQTDPLLLKRIIGNLIANAIKYTQTGGVLVACRQTQRRFRIEIWDTGSGITKEEQSLVFDAFYKSPTHAGTNDGFGLGLSIVTQLAEKLGCKLQMTSRPGRGTMMAIELNAMFTP